MSKTPGHPRPRPQDAFIGMIVLLLKGGAGELFLRDLLEESPRGSALVAGAWLEDALGEVLRAFFVEDEKLADELLGINGPVGTFANRTKVCFALGLISPREHHNLTVVRKIRNRAAHLRDPKKKTHQWDADGFSSNEVQRLCGTFQLDAVLARALRGETPRHVFATVAALLLVQLDTRRDKVQHRPIRKGKMTVS